MSKDECIDHFLELLYEQQSEIWRLRLEIEGLKTENIDPKKCKHLDGYDSQGPYRAVICKTCGKEL